MYVLYIDYAFLIYLLHIYDMLVGYAKIQRADDCCRFIMGGCSYRNSAFGPICWSCRRFSCDGPCLGVLQCVAVCCSVLQCVALCCRVLQSVAVCCSVVLRAAVCCSVLHCIAVCRGVVQFVAGVVQFVAGVVQCGAARLRCCFTCDGPCRSVL